MSEHLIEENKGCDVCGTVVDQEGPDGYLRLESDSQVHANVCSWLCATQFTVLKAAEQRKSFVAQIERLKQENRGLEYDAYLLPYYRAGVL